MTSGRNATSNQPQHVSVVPKQRDSGAPASQDASVRNTLFVSMALNMSWQLAIVVLLPILGGYYLDSHQHATPWFTLGGLVLAVVGVIGVLAKTVASANERVNGAK